MAAQVAFWFCILQVLFSGVDLYSEKTSEFLREYSENIDLLGKNSSAITHWSEEFTILLDTEIHDMLASDSLLCDVISSSSTLISNAVKAYFNSGHGNTLKASDIHSVLYPLATILLDSILQEDRFYNHVRSTITKPVCRNGLTPLEHATKLYNVYVLQSLLSFASKNYPQQIDCKTLECSLMFHLASVKQDIALVYLLLNHFPPDNRTLCQTYSTLYYICALDLQSCDILHHMQQRTNIDHQCRQQEYQPPLIINNLLLTRTLDDQYPGGHTGVIADEYGSGGWFRSPSSSVEMMQRSCNIPVANLKDLTVEDFTILNHMSIPLLIRDGLQGSPLFKEWTKSNILEKYGHLDVLGGPIPYGELFGEESGVSSLREFIDYMSQYNKQKNKPLPLYIFDGYIIPEHFADMVTMPSKLQIWTNATYIHQFILGPADHFWETRKCPYLRGVHIEGCHCIITFTGSGAPFHYHCSAINSLVYGRKRWFLYPPGKGYYSKIHPLKWNKVDGEQEPIECVQYAGDIMFVPSGWSHSTLNIDDCIGHAIEVDTFDC